MEIGSDGAANRQFVKQFQSGGRGRTRTYEGIASGFTVRPLCRSGHSPISTHSVDRTKKTEPTLSGYGALYGQPTRRSQWRPVRRAGDRVSHGKVQPDRPFGP